MRHLINILPRPSGTATRPGTGGKKSFLSELQESIGNRAINETVHLDSPAFQTWFSGSKVVDAEGKPLPVYHGTARPDRVGTQFRKARATAGPMAYFTDDATVASNYASSKPDTSLTDSWDYGDWFKVRVPGKRAPVSVGSTWALLSAAQRATMMKLAPRVMRDEEDETIVLGDEDHTDGLGNFPYSLRDVHGNVLKALISEWLGSASLHDEEQHFLTVLHLAGFPFPVEFQHPHATYPFVYSVYLAIKNPLVSTSIPKPVLDALSAAGARRRAPSSEGGQWDKKYVDPKAWLRDLLDDIESTSGVNSWTTVPDWVTATLSKLGYDGIKDVGGKNGGQSHAVWIPFHEHQVKSAVSNFGGFDPNKKDIHR